MNTTSESFAAEKRKFEISPASFRDPSGFVFTSDGTLYRQVNRSYQPHYDRLLESGLYDALLKRNLLVRHEEVEELASEREFAYKVLCPEKIDFISYPYEWSFSQLQDAALLTLEVQLTALEYGLVLKDASAYNVQFKDGQPILIDTLSFENYEQGRPWVAYRQFCQHFLAPLALMAEADIRLSQLLRVHLDGVPLDLASKLLPRRTWLRGGLATHLHLHAKTQRAYSASEGKGAEQAKRVGNVSERGLVGLLQGLRKTVSKLDWKPLGTEWGAYYRATNYTDEAVQDKRRLVQDFLVRAKPVRVWDLGANTGVYSRVASSMDIPTIAFDIDPAAVESNYRQTCQKGEKCLLPLLLDVTNPSPGIGWDGSERGSLFSRGPTDCIMALALIHHLAISNNVPLEKIAQFFSRLGSFLIIEFVPKADSQVQRLLRSREDIFTEFDQCHFEAAFSNYFSISRSEPIQETERSLYLMRRKSHAIIG